LLVECGNPVEVASVKSLLDANGIAHVVQGEQHASMIGGVFGSTIIFPRVLVAQRDLERAQALLTAQPVLDGTAPESGAAFEGAVCPVHEAKAIATCGRCGTFLCERCKSLGSPPVCEDCVAHEQP